MVPAYVGSARPATANLFLQYLWECNWFALELSYPIGLDLHSKECWCMLCARFTRTPFRSDTGQTAPWSTDVKLGQLPQWKRFRASG